MPGEDALQGALYHELLENGQQRVFTVEGVVLRRHTGLGQFLEIVDLQGYGRTLFLDGVRQSSAADEFIYHEMLVHPALFGSGAPRRVLIAGGGEGATAREVLRHRSVTDAVQVDLDPEVVEACRTHLPSFGDGAYEDPRLTLVHDDVRAYLERSDEPFDAIVLDVPEWIGGSELERLYEPAFFALLTRRLAPGGVISGQIGPVHPTRTSSFLPFARARQAAFPHTSFYVVPELGWIFGLASVDLPVEPSGSMGAALRSPVRYYSPALYARTSFLPPYLASELGRDRVDGSGKGQRALGQQG